MKKQIISFFISAFFIFSSFANGGGGGVLVVEGKYQNKNLYVQNGFSASGVGFCAYEVSVNGQVSTDEVNSSAFEVDLANYHIEPGARVEIKIKYKDGCSPRVLNPDALRPRAVFETVSISVNKTGMLNWITREEDGTLPFIIEEFRWNKWIPVGEVAGIGTPDKNQYSFQTSVHSGENKFRVKQTGYGGKSKFSLPVSYVSNMPQLTFTTSKHSNDVLFSGETLFEVYDLYGNVVKRGFGRSLDVSSLRKGMYYLCYDNTTADFKKK